METNAHVFAREVFKRKDVDMESIVRMIMKDVDGKPVTRMEAIQIMQDVLEAEKKNS